MPYQNSNNKHDIVEVLEYYGFQIPRNRPGWITVRCAFHNDRVKSARVNTENGGFRCFACEMSGDVYSVIMKKEGVKYREAVQIAERITGSSEQEIRRGGGAGAAVSRGTGNHGNNGAYVPPRLRRGA